jgi:hypothetical protein
MNIPQNVGPHEIYNLQYSSSSNFENVFLDKQADKINHPNHKMHMDKILPNVQQGFSRTPKAPHPNSPSYKQLHVTILATITHKIDSTQKFYIKSCISFPLEATS